MKHAKNVEAIETFLKEHRSSGHNYHDVAEKTGVSRSATKHIIRKLVHEGKVRRTQREEQRRDSKEKAFKLVKDPENPEKTKKVPIKHSFAYFQWR